MEEMREAAMAYYANMSHDQQLMVLGFYESIDTNGDGKVSVQEYLDFLKQKGYNRHVPPNLFKLLDKNNDGTLDFEECVTFFYMVAGHRLVICDGCRSYLWGLHFLCVECHSAGGRTFDLCCSCYRKNNFSHAHSTFLDNYALLRTKPRKPKQEVSPREEEADDDDDDDDDEEEEDDDDDDDDDEEEEEEGFVPRNRIVIHHHIVNGPPEKWPQAPSAYNNFIKNEIRSPKTEHPNMTHKEAFSASAKNVEIKEVVEAINMGWEIGTHVADIADIANNAGCTIM